MISDCHCHAQAAHAGAAIAFASRSDVPEYLALAAFVGAQAGSQTQPTAGATAVGIVVAMAAVLVGRCDAAEARTGSVSALLRRTAFAHRLRPRSIPFAKRHKTPRPSQ